MTAFYNEHDPYAAAWLRNLIDAGHIAPGVVDERDIRDIFPDELAGFTQCHWFAGIGVWSYALRRAGWSDDSPVWTGSCPCQPFSAAGKGGGFGDERHLWPAWHHLIRECRPGVVFGEQVASRDGEAWLDLVQADMEGEGYALGPIVFPASGVGAPHIRHRTYFVAHAGIGRLRRFDGREPALESPHLIAARRLADPDEDGRSPVPEPGLHHAARHAEPRGGLGVMGDAGDARLSPRERAAVVGEGRRSEGRAAQQPSGASGVLADAGRDRPQGPGPTNGFWRNADWLRCRDERWRPVMPGTSPLASVAPRRMGSVRADEETPSRVGRLRGYGNAIVAEAAAAFITAYLDGQSRA